MNEIVKRESDTGGIVRQASCRFDELEKMAELLAKSKMFGGWDTKDKVLALLLISQTEGGNPCVAVQRYFPITNAQGQTSTGKWAKAMLIDFLERGGKVKWLTTTPQLAQAEFTMEGREPYTMKYTWEEAVRAKLTGKSNWLNHPTDMLCNAVISKGLRRFDPASTSFMYCEAEGVETFNDSANGEDGRQGGEGEKKPTTTPPQEIFGVKGKSGNKKKEEKAVEGEVMPSDAPVAKAMADATVPPVVPEGLKVGHAEGLEKLAELGNDTKSPVVEDSEYIKLMKSLPQDKLLPYLVSIKYIKQGEGYEKVSAPRQIGAIKNFEGLKAKVEAFVPFGSEA